MGISGRSILILSGLFVVSFALYFWCGAPSVLYGDSAELQTVGTTGGVAHPSGYPTFLMTGQLLRQVIPGEPARRITIISSFFGALTLCALFLLLRKFGLSAGSALAGTVVYGTSFTYWWGAIRAEVYTQALFVFLLALWRVVVAFEKPGLANAAWAAALLGLTMTCHLSFGPAIFVLGILLALRRPEPGTVRAAYCAVLLVVFIAAFVVPYLYLVSVDRGDHPVNYLDYRIELEAGQFGLTEETFNDPWERIPWLLIGDASRPTHFLLRPFTLIRSAADVTASEFLFEYGILGFLVFLFGLLHLRKIPRERAAILLAVIVPCLFFAIVFWMSRRMLPVFLMPAHLGIAMVIAFGIRHLLETDVGKRPFGRRGRRVLEGALFALMIVTPHATRVYAESNPIGPTHWRVNIEAEPRITSFVPHLRGFWDARDLGEKIMSVAPENAVLVGPWREIMVLYYLHYAEGKRPDLQINLYNPELYIRLKRWEDSHSLAIHPIVIVGRPRGLEEEIVGLDSLEVGEGKFLFFCREGLKGE